MKSLSGRKNFLEQPGFGFTNSLLYSLEESRKLWTLITLNFDFALKTYCTLKMFLLSAQNNFYITLSEFICRRACDKKIQVWTLYIWLVSRDPKFWCFFGKFTVGQVLKSFSCNLFWDFVIVIQMIWKNQ